MMWFWSSLSVSLCRRCAGLGFLSCGRNYPRPAGARRDHQQRPGASQQACPAWHAPHGLRAGLVGVCERVELAPGRD
ncbi:hypothetical protein IWX48DRAFT_601460 [Phyllosticta citricarpa]